MEMARVGCRVFFSLATLVGAGACGSPSTSSLFTPGSGLTPLTGGSGGTAGTTSVATGGTSTGGTTALTGGTTGSGGTSTGGSTANECAKATGSSPVIDTFEDRDGDIAALEGRSGTWNIFNDGSSWQQPSTALPSFNSVTRTGSSFAMHTWGGIFNVWGAAVGFSLDQCADASVYSGVKFWAMGNVPVTFAVYSPGTIPVSDGGTCTGMCWGHFAKRVTPSPGKWAQFSIKWSDLSQPSWATPATFEPAHVMGMQFGLVSTDLANVSSGQFDAWIDDVQFF